MLNYLDHWEEFTIWRELYNDPDSEIDQDLLRSFDKNFSAYHRLLVKIIKVIKPAKVVPPEDNLEAYDATQKFETLLKGYFGKNLKGGTHLSLRKKLNCVRRTTYKVYYFLEAPSTSTRDFVDCCVRVHWPL